MVSLSAYARISGQRPGQDCGDLLWLTLSNLKQVSKFEKAKPLFDGFAYPNASAAVSVPVEVTTLRKNLENFRSVLYSTAQHLKTVDMADSQRDTLMKQYDKAYQDVGAFSGELMQAEQDRLRTDRTSRKSVFTSYY
eukprot:COSAG01_NODE_6265_length_3764_cov_1.787995_3_plen_137_part_00